MTRNLRLAALAAALFITFASCGGGGPPSPPTPSSPPPPPPPPPPPTYLWRPVKIGGGGFISGYDSDASGTTRIVRTDVYGAYVWSDARNRWLQLVTTASMPTASQRRRTAGGGVFEAVVAPSSSRRIYMALDGQIYRSDNAGATFIQPSISTAASFPVAFDANSEFRLYGPYLSISPANADLVFFGTPADGLWRSANAGASWSKVTSVPNGVDIRGAAGIQSPGVTAWYEKNATGAYTGAVWAMSYGNGVYRSGNGDTSFSPLVAATAPQPKGLKQGSFATDGSFYGVDPESQTVWKFRAGAWTNLTARVSGASHRFSAVAIQPGSNAILVFDDGGRGFRSVDAGVSWKSLSQRAIVGAGDPPWLHLTSRSYFATGTVDADPVVPNRIWNSAGAGPYYADLPTTSDSIVWTSQARGIEELVTNDILHAPQQAPLFAAWDFGIHRKEDLDTYSATYGPQERVLISAQQLDYSPSNPAFVVTNASDARMNCCSEDGQSVLAGYSQDGGRTWTRFATLPTPPGTDSSDPWRMSFGTIAVAATDTNNIVWQPAFNRSPFYTRDRGRTWSRVTFTGETLPNTGSYDQLSYKRQTLAADRVTPGTFYLVHSGDGANAALTGLWRTQNGGANWSKVFSGQIAPQSAFSAKLHAVPGRAGHLFFTTGVADTGGTPLMRSTDGGASWQAVPKVDRVTDVAFGRPLTNAGYPSVFIAGNVNGIYGIWRSDDTAATWLQIGDFPLGSLDEITTIEADQDVFGRLYVGFRGSGWAYGDAAPCTPKAFAFGDDTHCYSIP